MSENEGTQPKWLTYISPKELPYSQSLGFPLEEVIQVIPLHHIALPRKDVHWPGKM